MNYSFEQIDDLLKRLVKEAVPEQADLETIRRLIEEQRELVERCFVKNVIEDRDFLKAILIQKEESLLSILYRVIPMLPVEVSDKLIANLVRREINFPQLLFLNAGEVINAWLRRRNGRDEEIQGLECVLSSSLGPLFKEKYPECEERLRVLMQAQTLASLEWVPSLGGLWLNQRHDFPDLLPGDQGGSEGETESDNSEPQAGPRVVIEGLDAVLDRRANPRAPDPYSRRHTVPVRANTSNYNSASVSSQGAERESSEVSSDGKNEPQSPSPSPGLHRGVKRPR